LANSVSKLNWFIQERKEPSKKEYCKVFLKKNETAKKERILQNILQKRKELSGENIAEY
jgi:hypothetical protein